MTFRFSRRNNMLPVGSPNDVRDRRLCDAEHPSNLAKAVSLGRVQFPNLANPIISKNRFPLLLAADHCSVNPFVVDVFEMCCVSKIVETVFRCAAIVVAGKMPWRYRTNEGLENEPVNKFVAFVASLAKNHVPIPSRLTGRHDLAWAGPSFSALRGNEPVKTPHSAKIRDFVEAFVARNRLPNFHRGSINFGHADLQQGSGVQGRVRVSALARLAHCTTSGDR